jgi:hypothetical protein
VQTFDIKAACWRSLSEPDKRHKYDYPNKEYERAIPNDLEGKSFCSGMLNEREG